MRTENQTGPLMVPSIAWPHRSCNAIGASPALAIPVIELNGHAGSWGRTLLLTRTMVIMDTDACGSSSCSICP